MNNSLRHRRGYTLLELIVTITILGILAALFAPAYNGVKLQARDQVAVRNAEALLRAAVADAELGMSLPDAIDAEGLEFGDRYDASNNYLTTEGIAVQITDEGTIARVMTI